MCVCVCDATDITTAAPISRGLQWASRSISTPGRNVSPGFSPGRAIRARLCCGPGRVAGSVSRPCRHQIIQGWLASKISLRGLGWSAGGKDRSSEAALFSSLPAWEGPPHRYGDKHRHGGVLLGLLVQPPLQHHLVMAWYVSTGSLGLVEPNNSSAVFKKNILHCCYSFSFQNRLILKILDK